MVAATAPTPYPLFIFTFFGASMVLSFLVPQCNALAHCTVIGFPDLDWINCNPLLSWICILLCTIALVVRCLIILCTLALLAFLVCNIYCCNLFVHCNLYLALVRGKGLFRLIPKAIFLTNSMDHLTQFLNIRMISLFFDAFGSMVILPKLAWKQFCFFIYPP